MRKVLFLFLGLFCFSGIFAQNGLFFDTAVTVANPSIHDNLRPQITLSNGNPLIIWGSIIGGRKGWVARWNGLDFDLPQRINPSGLISVNTVEGPNIAARGDTAYLVYATPTNNNPQIILRSSFDAGVTWNPGVWVDSLGSDFPTFPNIALSPDRNPVVLYLRQQSNWANPRHVMRRSDDGGASYTAETSVSGSAPGGEVCDCCAGTIYAPDNRIVGLFRNNDNNLRDMWATISTDSGATFNIAIDMDTTDWQIAACPSSGPKAHFIGDSIVSVFMSGSSGQQLVYYGAAHMDSTQPAYNRSIIDSVAGSVGQNYPSIAGNSDTMAVVWAHNDGGTETDILMAWSVTGTAGLRTNTVYNLTAALDGHQRFPDIAFHKGIFHVTWADDLGGNVMYRRAGFSQLLAQQVANGQDFTVYPVPATGDLKLRLETQTNAPFKVRLSDVNGKVVRAYNVVSGPEIQVRREGLPAGIYFLHVEGRGAKKVIWQ